MSKATEVETDAMRVVRELTEFITAKLPEPRADEVIFELYIEENSREQAIEGVGLEASDTPRVAASELWDAAYEDAEDRVGRAKYVVRPQNSQAKLVFFVDGRREPEVEFEDVEFEDVEALALRNLVEKQIGLMKLGLLALCFVVAVQSFTMAWLLHGKS